jgi:predicted Fe-S protein YdhL (DUF1289 family)
MAAPVDPPSPCTNLCTINPDTGECEGCGRTLDEIAAWGTMTPDEKLAVLRRVGKEPDGED